MPRVRVDLECLDVEKAKWMHKAESLGLTLSAWMRLTLNGVSVPNVARTWRSDLDEDR